MFAVLLLEHSSIKLVIQIIVIYYTLLHIVVIKLFKIDIVYNKRKEYFCIYSNQTLNFEKIMFFLLINIVNHVFRENYLLKSK